MDLKIFKTVVVTILLLLTITCKEKDENNNEPPVIPLLDTIATGLSNPLGIVSGDDNRLFIVEQPGTISVIDIHGNINSDKFLDISDRIKYGGEQGLLGLAFHPTFANNGWFFVHYTGENDSIHISRFSRMLNDPDRADPGSEQRIITIPDPYTNHNGGQITFGPDGYLYISFGDGGSAGDPHNFAQDIMVMHGKLLRIDVNSEYAYTVPDTNPFAGDTSALPEIWAYGLRNPWRFSFDRLTGDLWIADVGQHDIEEINFQTAGSQGGENYGWRCYEGSVEFITENCNGSAGFTFPVHEYTHGSSECSVTGGYVYRGNEESKYYGRYFFADYCSDNIWTLRNQGAGLQEEHYGRFPGNSFSSFGEDDTGNLYVAGHTSGNIYRLRL